MSKKFSDLDAAVRFMLELEAKGLVMMPNDCELSENEYNQYYTYSEDTGYVSGMVVNYTV